MTTTTRRNVRGRHSIASAAAFFFALTLAALLAAAVARAGEEYEVAGVVAAADYLPAELMKGPEWTVAAEATNDGLDNTYTLETRFGEWEARGEHQVVTRIREVEALVRLEEVSKTKVFLDAVEASVTSPIRLVKDAAERPKETIKGLPRGLHRWYRRTSFKIRETYHDVSVEVKEERARRAAKKAAEGEQASEPAGADAGEAGGDGGEASGDAGEAGADAGESSEEAQEAAESSEEVGKDRREELEEKAETTARKEALDYLRITDAERRWYRELGVDPSTDNELVRDGVKSVARVEGLTNFAMKLVALPSIPYAGILRDSMDLVWSTSVTDLRARNRRRIREAGLSTETARAFEDGMLTLTQQTAFLEAMDGLWAVRGREQLFALALDLETPEEARALTAMAVLLAGLHQGGTPLAEILPGSALPVARTRAGGLVATASAGAIFCTQEIAEGWLAFTEIHADVQATDRRLYVTGITSERFDAEAKSRGWEVIDRWKPEPAAPAG